MVNESVGNKVCLPRSVHEVLWGYEDPIWHAVHLELHALNYARADLPDRVERLLRGAVPVHLPLWSDVPVGDSWMSVTTTNLHTLEDPEPSATRCIRYLEQWAGSGSCGGGESKGWVHHGARSRRCLRTGSRIMTKMRWTMTRVMQ